VRSVIVGWPTGVGRSVGPVVAKPLLRRIRREPYLLLSNPAL